MIYLRRDYGAIALIAPHIRLDARSSPLNAEIISIGTELLMGEIVDTNSAYLADELAKIGVELRWATKVGDHPARLQEAIERALRRSDITITTGGLGPTSDDLTRESIAAVMGEEMEVQDDLLAHLRSQFESRGVTMPATNIKQATLIPSAEVIPNPMGTAPGWWVERDGHVIAAMPGPPREISYMWDNQVGPRLRALNPEIVIVTRTLKTFGITEGGLDEMLSSLFQSENPTLGIYSKQDGIHLRAIASASTESEAQSLIEPMEREIRKTAGHAIWGEDADTPVSAALDALSERGLTLAVAEGFTGGLLSSTLLESASASGIFAGAIVITGGESDRLTLGVSVASPDSPRPEDASGLALAARDKLGADVGLAMTPLVSEQAEDSGPVGTTHIGIALGDDVFVRSGHYPTRRLRIRARAVTHALLELARCVDTGAGGHESRWG